MTDQDSCIRAGVHRITGSCTLCGYGMTPDLPIPEAAIEDVAKAIYEAPHDGLSRKGYDAAPRDIQDLYRAEAKLAVAAALPHLRSLQVETQVRAGYAIGRSELIDLLADFVDEDDCWFDHHGYCQAHGWFRTDPACPHARAKALIGEDVRSQPQNATSEPRADLPGGPSHPKDSQTAREAL